MHILAIFMILVCTASCLAQDAPMPDHFNKPLRDRQRITLPDAFGKPRGKARERKEIPGHFSRKVETSRQRKKDQGDPFSKPYSIRERSADDLVIKSRPTKRYRKNFIGERLRFFARDPNRKKHRKKRKTRDPFGRKARDTDGGQSPKGESGLFQNGVLPKMKDVR